MTRVLRIDAEGNHIGEEPVVEGAGASDAGKLAALGEDGKFDASVLPPTGGLTYVHDQAIPSAEWIIVHNLNRYPSVTVVDTAGERWWSEVTYDSPNQLTVRHSAAFSGKAYLN